VKRAALCITALAILGLCGPLVAAEPRVFGPWQLKEWPEAKSNQPVWPNEAKPPYATWTVAGDTLRAVGKGDRWSTRLSPVAEQENVSVRLTFRVQKSSGRPRSLAGGCVRWYYFWGENASGWDASVVVRYKDPLNYYRVAVSAHRQELGLWDSTGGLLQLIPCKVELGKTHVLDVTVRGAHFTAKLDETPVMDYWDRTLPHGMGRVGLGVWGADVVFERMQCRPAPAQDKPMPPHKPQFRMDGVVVFDGHEPICYFKQGPGKKKALYHEAVKLKPGWRPAYYTCIGPRVQTTVLAWPDLVGPLPGGIRAEGNGKERLTLHFSTVDKAQVTTTHVMQIAFDAKRGTYAYTTDSVATFGTEVYMNSMEFLDPLTYNNRSPGPEVKYRWNPAGHKWHVFRGPDGAWLRYPMLDYLGENGFPMSWQTRGFLYPDPAVSPVFEVALKWEQRPKRFLSAGLCTWGYDYHHTEVGPGTTMPKGTVRKYRVRLAGYTPEEADAYFKQSSLVPKLRTERPQKAIFDPRGTSFDKLTTDAEATSTMIVDGTVDRSVGRTDSHSLRIDGPDSPRLFLYQYMVETCAKQWWIRGWARSKGLRGRGLQLRVKYSYAPKPEEIFYIGLLGDSDWTYFSFVTDVLKTRDCTSISFEVDGPGTVWIDDVALRHLEDGEEPKTTAFAMPTGLEPRTDMLIDLPMSEKPGKAVYDESRNAHALYLDGPTWVREDGRGFLRFDGVDDIAWVLLKPALHPLDAPRGTVGNDTYKPIFRLKQFTYECWVRPQQPPKGASYMTIFHYRSNPLVQCDQLTKTAGECRLVYQNDLFRSTKIRFEQAVPYGKWLHLVATHGNGKVVLYLNGKAVGKSDYDTAAPGFQFFAYHWRYNVGGFLGRKTRLWCGDMGPFRLHTKALTAEEVQNAFKNRWPSAQTKAP